MSAKKNLKTTEKYVNNQTVKPVANLFRLNFYV